MSKLRRYLSALLAALAVAGLVSVFGTRAGSSQAASLAGQLQRLQQADPHTAGSVLAPGKPTWVKFWASWCPACLSTLEETGQWRDNAAFHDVNIVTVASPQYLNERSEPSFRRWYAGLDGVRAPTLLDPSGRIAHELGIAVYPSWALLDADGRLQRIIKGNLSRADALALLDDPGHATGSAQEAFYKADANGHKGASPVRSKELYLAGGCFWGVEAYFERIPGVLDAVSGYANGKYRNPSYRDVIQNGAGHAETIRLSYDPDVLSLPQVLEHYLRIIDPTSLNRQGNDRGTQYRTGIYYTDPADEPVIAAVLAREQQKHSRPIVVENQPLHGFDAAEKYHQDYLAKNPGGYCHVDLSLAEKPLASEGEAGQQAQPGATGPGLRRADPAGHAGELKVRHTNAGAAL